ncbi:MAG: hypothetical protein IJQ34_10030 [Kiritimatiellae bacterium]|nr:hypothetical protein [Kiritimatiellia bacterium]
MKFAVGVLTVAIGAFSSFAGEILNLNSDWQFKKEGESEWRRVSVPHSVNAQEIFDSHTGAWGEDSFWKGVMSYRKKIWLDKVPAKAFLEIEAIRQTARVVVNGKDCGFYDAGICAIGFDVTEALKEGENEIEIITDNLMMNDKGGADYQWNEASFNPVQGGLTGNVRLHLKDNKSYFTLPLYSNLKTKGTYIWADDFDLEKGEATIHVDAEVVSDSPYSIRFSLSGQTFEGDKGRVKDLVFWSPDTPHLYDVEVELLGEGGEILDSEIIRTGFRKIDYDFSKGGLFINGKNFTLPGYAQRAVNCWAAIGLPTDWMMDWEMALVRESNANHIRWMHVAPKPNAVRSCDKMGVVVTSPAGDREMQTKGKYWHQRVEAMRDVIIYFRNSPSIFFWEAGNNQIRPECMREMRLLKEELDPNNGRFMGCRTLNTPEQIAEAEYVGTMINRHDAEAFRSMTTVGKFIPIMETEFCREEAPRRVWDDYSPPDFDYVNRWLGRGNRENGFDAHDKTQEDIARSNASDDGWTYFWGNRVNGKAGKYYTGWAMLCWSDQIELGRNSASENSRVSGRVDAARIKKENFHVLATLQSELPKIKILGHWSYPPFTDENYWYNNRRDTGHHWEWTDEKLRRDPEHKTVYVIGSKHIASIELFVNGVSKGVVSETKNSPFIYAFENIDITESGYIEAVARDCSGKEIARERIESAGTPAKIAVKTTVGPEGWIADGSDIAMIDLDLVDAQGRLIPCATEKLEFSISGPAILMGGYNSGTFKGDEKRPSPVGENWVRFECGQTRVFLKSLFEEGDVQLKVKCENGLETTVNLRTVDKKLPAPQAYPINERDFTVVPVSDAVREYNPKVGDLPIYSILVNGKRVVFSRKGAKPVKPDANTGVVAPFMPVLEMMNEEGAGLKIEAVKKQKNNKPLPEYLKGANYPYLKVTTLDAHTIECAAGETSLIYDEGKEKNLANCEMHEDGRHELVGELMALLQYITNAKVDIDDVRHVISIEIVK